ncbi:uncharacterized protein LOC144634056 [Oculina patagonica]
MADNMSLEERKRKLAIYLSFDAVENPGWRNSQEVSISKMITQIMRYHKEWEEIKSSAGYDEKLVKKVQKEFLVEFIFHVNMEEESGFGTFEETEKFLKSFYARGGNYKRQFSINEQETVNLMSAYEYLLEKIKREERASDYGLIEPYLLKETHRILMKDINLKEGSTKPGEFSNNPRYTDFKGERYHYPHYPKPKDMVNAVDSLLDQYNNLFDLCTRDQLKDFDDFSYLFKTCAWLLFELLDLHPFSDGNGRLCRILCSYVLSKFTPFPTPVYNVWTESKKDDYKQALWDTRVSGKRLPTALTTMIIECNYHGWRKFFEALNREKGSCS